MTFNTYNLDLSIQIGTEDNNEIPTIVGWSLTSKKHEKLTHGRLKTIAVGAQDALNLFIRDKKLT